MGGWNERWERWVWGEREGIRMRWSSIICCLIDRSIGTTELEILHLQNEQLK